MGKEGAFLLLGPQKRRWFFSDKDAEVHPLVIEIDKRKRIELDAKGTVQLFSLQ